MTITIGESLLARSYELRGSDKECFNVSDLSEYSSGDHAVIAGRGRSRPYLALVIVSAMQRGVRQMELPRRQLAFTEARALSQWRADQPALARCSFLTMTATSGRQLRFRLQRQPQPGRFNISKLIPTVFKACTVQNIKLAQVQLLDS